MKKHIRLILIPLLVLVVGCKSAPDVPKPNAYLRLDMPPHTYLPAGRQALPFSFELNTSAQLIEKKTTTNEVWVDIQYPQWDGVVFLSYKHLASPADLRGQTDTSLRLMESHYQFTSGVEEKGYEDPSHHVYATTYHLKGRSVASTYQFWATDSLHHFLRGALYINRQPNNDSLAPILGYIQTDINHLIETLQWGE